MAEVEYSKERGQLFSVLSSDGTFRRKVPEGTEGAVRRTYETSDGKKGEKWEYVAQRITGIIDYITLHEGDYGENLIVSFQLGEDEEEQDRVSVSLSAHTPFGEQFMHKLPNIDPAKPVTLVPYSFTSDDGKSVKGLNVIQDEAKLTSAYQTYDEDKKGFVYLDKKFPKPNKKKTYKKSDWRAYFTEVRTYLLEQTEKHPLFKSDDSEEDF